MVSRDYFTKFITKHAVNSKMLFSTINLLLNIALTPPHNSEKQRKHGELTLFLNNKIIRACIAADVNTDDMCNACEKDGTMGTCSTFTELCCH